MGLIPRLVTRIASGLGQMSPVGRVIFAHGGGSVRVECWRGSSISNSEIRESEGIKKRNTRIVGVLALLDSGGRVTQRSAKRTAVNHHSYRPRRWFNDKSLIAYLKGRQRALNDILCALCYERLLSVADRAIL